MSHDIVDRFQKNINKCDICLNTYDRKLHIPVIICSNHHSICKDCVEGLKVKPNCPFCRQRITFDKVVINNYIYELLPPDGIEANSRKEVITPSWNNPLEQQKSRHNQEDSQRNQPDNRINMDNINNRPLEHIYPQGYNAVNQDDSDQVHTNGRLTSENKHYLLLLLCVQIPFTFFNFYFSITLPRSVCMDQPQGISILVVRPWFFGIGIAECILMLAMIFPIIFFKGRCIEYRTLLSCWGVVGLIAILKILIWAVIQLQLFARVIVHFCSGGVFIYGIIMTVIHTILLIGVCCCSGSRSGAFY